MTNEAAAVSAVVAVARSVLRKGNLITWDGLSSPRAHPVGTPAQAGAGCAVRGRRVVGGGGVAASLTLRGVDARFVARTWARPARLGRPAARMADWAKGRRVLSGMRGLSFRLLKRLRAAFRTFFLDAAFVSARLKVNVFNDGYSANGKFNVWEYMIKSWRAVTANRSPT